MQKTFLNRAIELSKESLTIDDGGPFGAVVIKDGEIIAEGKNEVIKNNDPTAHAEIMAIRRATEKLQNFDLSDCELYTNCEPCPMCLGAIYWARIGKVFYANTRKDAAAIGFDDNFIYEELKKPNTEREIEFVHAPNREALEIFKKWDEREDESRY